MPLPDPQDFLIRAEKGVAYAAVSGEEYILYAKQFSVVDGSELVGEDQVQAVSLAGIDAEMATLSARLDALQQMRDHLTGVTLTAAEANAQIDTARAAEVKP